MPLFFLQQLVPGNNFLAWQRNPHLGSLSDWQANYAGALLASAFRLPPFRLACCRSRALSSWVVPRCYSWIPLLSSRPVHAPCRRDTEVSQRGEKTSTVTCAGNYSARTCANCSDKPWHLGRNPCYNRGSFSPLVWPTCHTGRTANESTPHCQIPVCTPWRRRDESRRVGFFVGLRQGHRDEPTPIPHPLLVLLSCLVLSSASSQAAITPTGNV